MIVAGVELLLSGSCDPQDQEDHFKSKARYTATHGHGRPLRSARVPTLYTVHWP